MSFLRQAWEGRAYVMTGGAPEPERPGTDLPYGYGRTGGVEPGAGTWLPGMRWESWGTLGQSTDQAMRLSAVFACLRLLSEAIATLPMDTYRKVGDQRESYEKPSYLRFDVPLLSVISYLSQSMLSLLTDGNAFIGTPRDEYGIPTALLPLQPEKVEVRRGRDGIPYYIVEGEAYSYLDIMHIPGMMLPGELRGVSPLKAAREVVDGGRKAQEYGSSFLANSAMPPAVINVPDIPDTDEEATLKARRIAESWKATHGGTANAGGIGVLLGGATLDTVAVSPKDAEWIDSKRFGVSEIARFYGVPPHLIADASNSTSWGSGLAEQNLAFGQFSLRPWTERLEAAHNRLLSTTGLPDVFVKLKLDALLRASLKDRYDSYAIGIEHEFLLDDEARSLEDLPPLPKKISREDADAAGALIRAGFEPAAALAALGLPPIKHTGTLPVTVQPEAP